MDAPDAVALGDRGEHVEARDHPAEHRVGAVEVRLGRVGDEELAAACVGPRERHTHGTHLVAGGIHLVPQHESRSAPPVAPRVATASRPSALACAIAPRADTAESRASSNGSPAARAYAWVRRSTSATAGWRPSTSAATLRTAASGCVSSWRARGPSVVSPAGTM